MLDLSRYDVVRHQFLLTGIAKRYRLENVAPFWPPMRLVEDAFKFPTTLSAEDWLFEVASGAELT